MPARPMPLPGRPAQGARLRAATLALGALLLGGAGPGARAMEVDRAAAQGGAPGPVESSHAEVPLRGVDGPGADASPAASPPARTAPAARGSVALLIDRAKVIRLPERVQTVIVGNPLIADVTLQRNGVAVLTGKSYGVTNLIALDAAGTMLAEALVNVQAPTETVVTVQRGLDRETYSCTPHCQRSLLLGDSNTYFTEVGAQAERRNALATQR